MVQSDIRVLGHKELIIKCDQEPSVLALREQVKQGPFVVKDEESPVKESQSNGLIENTIRTEQGQIRAVKDGLDTRYERKVSREHHSLPWLVEHSAQCLNRYMVGRDGKTAYERAKGRPFRVPAAEFAECVWYKKPGTMGKEKWESRWETGVWLGPQ